MASLFGFHRDLILVGVASFSLSEGEMAWRDQLCVGANVIVACQFGLSPNCVVAYPIGSCCRDCQTS
jgi:hypothetical protein